MAFLIKLCSLVHFKSHMRIKSDRLWILLIDGQLNDPLGFNAILEQLLPHAFAPFLQRDKKHLQATVLNAHKRDRLFCFGRDQMLHAFQPLRHIRPDRVYFCARKKQMRCPHGLLPNFRKHVRQRLVLVLYFVRFHHGSRYTANPSQLPQARKPFLRAIRLVAACAGVHSITTLFCTCRAQLID